MTEPMFVAVFWVRSTSDYEKPHVDYTHQLYGEFLFEDPVSRKTQAFQYSTVRKVQDALPNPLAPPSIQCTHYDYDKDGHLDLYVTNNGSFYTAAASDHDHLLMGTGSLAGDNRWLELDLVGRISHPDALGARIDAQLGGTTLKRQLLGDGSYLGSPSRLIHFGLGQADFVDRLTIHWPSGVTQQLIEVADGLGVIQIGGVFMGGGGFLVGEAWQVWSKFHSHLNRRDALRESRRSIF